jgi:hypothetical protein
MIVEEVRVRELVAWGLDENKFRPSIDSLAMRIEFAGGEIAKRDRALSNDPLLKNVPRFVRDLLDQQLHRSDLQDEMRGLDWSVGIVDLRQLLAFQRRLVFDDHFFQGEVPSPDDWHALVALAFGPPVPITYHSVSSNNLELLLQSENPNLRILTSADGNQLPFQFHAGSPFFEAAEFRGRWFLRDGYHRAYRLIRAGVTHFPAAIVRARTFAELGPVQPWFFPEETLFDAQPPCVIDFLDDHLTIEYNRPRLFKTLRVTIEESIGPALFKCITGEQR